MKWESPKAHGTERHNWLKIAYELKDHPGEWALVAEDVVRTYVTHIKRGNIKAFYPPGSYEAVSRGYGTDHTRTAKLYARYVGK
jgi:hypothetical protein